MRGLRAVRPARARAVAVVCRVAGDRSSGSCACRRRCRTCSRASGSPPPRRSSARSSASRRRASPSGLGSAIINYNQYYTSGPERLWATIVMCTLVGLRLRRARPPGRAAAHAAAATDRWRDVTTEPSNERRPRRDVVGRGAPASARCSGPATAPSPPSNRSTSPSARASSCRSSARRGCGKSTLLRLIGDLTPPTSGTLLVNGKPAERARLDRDYGMVFQAPVLMDWRTVAKNIELPLEIMGYSAEERRAGPRTCSSSSSSRRSPTATRGSCRAACSSASRSRGRSPSIRSCC